MCDNDICGNRGTCVMYKQVLKCICDEMYFGLNCEKCENGQSVKNYCVQENMLNGAKISGIVFGCICVFVLIIVVVVVVRGKMNKPKKNDAKKQGDDEKGELVGDHSEEV